jgi:glycosidase
MKLKTAFLFVILLTHFAFAQSPKINKVEPPNWWIDHEYSNIQLMIYGENLGNCKIKSNDENLIVEKISHQNDNYLFVNVKVEKISNPKNYTFTISNIFGAEIVYFPLFERDNSENIHQGFSNKDVVYLIFPDRFANGDESNDFIFNDKEEFEFKSLNGRHGGDIQGIINKLDYLKDLGVTSIWITPLVENNTYMSYHGYAATNFYKIDPRFGTNDLYKELVEKAHEKGLKIILDHVANHIGLNHEWVKNLPTETWLHGNPENHLPAEHDKIAFVDINGDKKSISNVNEGWFVKEMPDLNQSDCLMAKYIIQNTIWWIEYAGIDGIREDTYPYANQKFLSDWAKTILDIYPKFNIVGEVWRGDAPVLAKFQSNSFFPKEFDSHLPAVTDFAMRDAIASYMSGKSNLTKIYETLGEDFVYSNPDNLLIFFDNHDTDRGMYVANGNLEKFMKALTIVLTSRGIPQIFYGTEIGLDGGAHHGKIRSEFPGGFPDDSLNAFTENGRTDLQNDIFNFTKKILELRNKYEVLQTGKLIQFPPKENVYCYKKVSVSKSIIIFLNDDNLDKTVNLNNYLNDFTTVTKLKNLLDEKKIEIQSSGEISLPQNSISILLVE